MSLFLFLERSILCRGRGLFFVGFLRFIICILLLVVGGSRCIKGLRLVERGNF